MRGTGGGGGLRGGLGPAHHARGVPCPAHHTHPAPPAAVHVDGSQPPLRYGVEVPRSATVGCANRAGLERERLAASLAGLSSPCRPRPTHPHLPCRPPHCPLPCPACSQLYGTLAHLVGLQAAGEGEAPEDRLLLTQFNLSSGDGAVYADLKVRPSAPCSLFAACACSLCAAPEPGPAVSRACTGASGCRCLPSKRTPPVHRHAPHPAHAQARVSGIEDLKSRFSFSRTAGHLYVLYVYPSAAEGPRAPDRRPVIVYHK